jgi:hypothetical protein
LSSLQATSALKKQDHAKRQVLISIAQLMGCIINLAIPAVNISVTIAQRVVRATKASTSHIYSYSFFIMYLLTSLGKKILRDS